MKFIISTIATIVVAGAGLFVARDQLLPSQGSTIPEGALHTVQRGDLRITITENGSLMAKNSEKITAKTRRGGKITFLVEEGKTVEEGEVLCRLETTELETQKQQRELDIVKTEADLKTANTELEIQKRDNIANIEKAKASLERARQELEKYVEGDAPTERRNLEIDIKDKQNQFNRAEKKYQDSTKLLEQDYVNESQVKLDRIEFERAEVQLTSAQRNLELFDKYTYPMTLAQKETAVTDAEREVENAGMRAESTLRQREVAVESQESRLTRLRQQLDELNEELAACEIISPSPGIVIYGDPTQYWMRGEIKLGGQVWSGFTLFTIPDLRVMQVQVQIHEADINKLEEGQIATVTMDTYPGLVLTGKVSKIASIAGAGQSFNPYQQDAVKKFTVEIILDSTPEVTLKPGISAKAEIFIEEREQALFVPLQSVFLEGAQHYCHVMNARGEPVKKEIVVGSSNDTYIEVVEGLEEGEQILLYNPAISGSTVDAEEPSDSSEGDSDAEELIDTDDSDTAQSDSSEDAEAITPDTSEG